MREYEHRRLRNDRCRQCLDRRNAGTRSANFPPCVIDTSDSKRTANFAGACNAGARTAAAPLTLLLNNDAYPLGRRLRHRSSRAFDRHDVAIAGGALFFEDGVTQAAGWSSFQTHTGIITSETFRPLLDAVDRSRDALGVSGAAMAFRTAWFLENGGFDDSFVNGFEDVDLCLRAREQGRAHRLRRRCAIRALRSGIRGPIRREAENERRFLGAGRPDEAACTYARGRSARSSCAMASPTKTRSLRAAFADLEGGIAVVRTSGHASFHSRHGGASTARFRAAASLSWFGAGAPDRRVSRSVEAALADAGYSDARCRRHEVPWLPCAALERAQRFAMRCSEDASCTAVGIVGEEGGPTPRASLRSAIVRSNSSPIGCLAAIAVELACVVACRAHRRCRIRERPAQRKPELPAVVLGIATLRALFARRCSTDLPRNGSRRAILSHLRQRRTLRRHRYGTLVAAGFAPPILSSA